MLMTLRILSNSGVSIMPKWVADVFDYILGKVFQGF